MARSKKPNVHIDRSKMNKIIEATQGARTRAGLVPAVPHPVAAPKLSETPCPRCLELATDRLVRPEVVQRMPEGVGIAPIARDGSGKCCFDCASADALTGRMGLTFLMARIAVGNDRQEQYRLPGVPMGLAMDGQIRKSAPGDLEDQHRWLDRLNWFDILDEET